jgi:hypothetical protein
MALSFPKYEKTSLTNTMDPIQDDNMPVAPVADDAAMDAPMADDATAMPMADVVADDTTEGAEPMAA